MREQQDNGTMQCNVQLDTKLPAYFRLHIHVSVVKRRPHLKGFLLAFSGNLTHMQANVHTYRNACGEEQSTEENHCIIVFRLQV